MIIHRLYYLITLTHMDEETLGANEVGLPYQDSNSQP